jgi:hypothetical protein
MEVARIVFELKILICKNSNPLVIEEDVNILFLLKMTLKNNKIYNNS